MSALTSDTTIVRAQHVVFSKVAEALVMMDADAGRYYSLDEIGADVWDHLAEPVTLGALCEALRQRYDVEPETCARDVTALVGDLIAAGLVETTA